MNEPTRIAAIDIGSDTVHLLVGSVDGTGDDSVVTRVEQRIELIELGRRVAQKGWVSDRAAGALTEGRTRVASVSLPVGAAALGAALRSDPPNALSWALAGTQIGRAAALAPEGKRVQAWATGGSAHNLAGLEPTRGKSGKQELTLEDLRDLAADLLSLPSSKLAKPSAEDPRRVAMPPGLLIIARVVTHYGLDRVTVVPEGLREGMILAVAKLGDDWWCDT